MSSNIVFQVMVLFFVALSAFDVKRSTGKEKVELYTSYFIVSISSIYTLMHAAAAMDVVLYNCKKI